MGMEEKELKALVSLLDDDDTEVLSEVEKKIISLGSEIIPFLEREWETSFSPNVQRRIEDIIHVVQYDHLKDRMAEWGEDPNNDLLTGMWLVASYQYPELELNQLKQDLEQIYYDAWMEFKPDMHAYDQIKILNSVLFGKLRFSANTKNFHSPSNSMINIVMESKKGNPISLCVIYQLVAQKLNMPVFGVNLPNLFILTYKSEKVEQFYINAFNRGLIFTKEDIDNYIAELGLIQHNTYYEPCTNKDIVVRVLRNLIMSFEKIGDHHKAEEVKLLLYQLEV